MRVFWSHWVGAATGVIDEKELTVAFREAKQYFEDLGFICPPRWTTADFLTSVTDPHERHVKPGWENRIPRTAEEFENAYRNSKAYEANIRDIEGFEETLKEQQTAVVTAKRKNYTISFQKQVVACTQRQFKVMLGDKLSLGARWIGLSFQSLIVGSLFFNLPDTALGVFPRGGILFFTLLFNALLALAEMTSSFASRPILMKHKAFSFYRPSAYAIAQVVADIPLCFMQVVIWGIIVYFMASEYSCSFIPRYRVIADDPRSSPNGVSVLHLPADHLLPVLNDVLLFQDARSIFGESRRRDSNHRCVNPGHDRVHRVPDPADVNAPLVFVDPLDQPSAVQFRSCHGERIL
jgi:hypothetical protein